VDDLPVIDAARLTLITRGNTALAAEFLAGLVEESDGLIERLRILLDGKPDAAAVRDAAHTLKGMAMEVGALRLRAVAAVLEAESEPKLWPEYVGHLSAALDEVRAYPTP
jgi:HPt (histidine-containing phosphotransfer) domain-containing protein